MLKQILDAVNGYKTYIGVAGTIVGVVLTILGKTLSPEQLQAVTTAVAIGFAVLMVVGIRHKVVKAKAAKAGSQIKAS